MLLWAAPFAAHPEQLMMVRLQEGFPEAMNALQAAIVKRGYTISRIQRVDVGLTRSGYKTEAYRVVFFGKPDQIRSLSARHPQLIPFLPLKITIEAEGQDTLLLALDPMVLDGFFPRLGLRPVFQGWETDLRAILDAAKADQ